MYRQSNIFINVTASDNPATTVFVTPRAAADCILVTFGTIDPVVAVPVLSPLSTGRQPSPPSPPIVLVYCRGATSFHVVGEGRDDECLLPCSCRGWRLLAGAVTICRHRCRGGGMPRVVSPVEQNIRDLHLHPTRRAIQAIMADPNLSELEKRVRIQQLMSPSSSNVGEANGGSLLEGDDARCPLQ
jgi:hypothetical protein